MQSTFLTTLKGINSTSSHVAFVKPIMPQPVAYYNAAACLQWPLSKLSRCHNHSKYQLNMTNVMLQAQQTEYFTCKNRISNSK